MDHMAPTIFELSGVYPVQRIVLGGFCRAYIDIDGSESCIGGYSIQPDLGGLGCWFRMTKVDKGPGWTHGCKCACGDHIDLPGRLFRPLPLHDLRHLISGYHDHFALFDFAIDLFDGFGWFSFRHLYSNLQQLDQKRHHRDYEIRWQAKVSSSRTSFCSLDFPLTFR